MKAKVVNGVVTESVAYGPVLFNSNGEEYSQQQYYDLGWRNVVLEPLTDTNAQRYGDMVYDPVSDTVSAPIIDTVVPIFDPNIQKLGGRYYDEVNGIDTYQILSLTPEEMQIVRDELYAEEQAALHKRAILTPLTFLNRFTDNEAKSILGLAKTDPDVELWWIKYNKAQDIDLLDPQTISGVQALEDATILATGRAAEILTIPSV